MAYRWGTPTKTHSQLILSPVVEVLKPPPKPIEYTYELVNEKDIKICLAYILKCKATPQYIHISQSEAHMGYLTSSKEAGTWAFNTRLKKIPVMQEGNK